MSMLNEALRKKAREKDPKRAPGDALRRSPSVGHKRATTYLVAIAAVAAVIVGGLAAIGFFYGQAPGPAPVTPRSPAAAQPQAKSPETTAVVTTSTPTDSVGRQGTGEAPKLLTVVGDLPPRAAPSTTPTAVAVIRPPRLVPKKGARHKTPETRAPAVVDSRTVALFYQKGLSYHRQGRYEEAIRMYEKAISKDPGHIDAQINLAAAYIAVSDFTRAIAVLDTASALAPDNHQLLINRAVAEIGLGQTDSALTHIDMAERYADVPRFDIHFHRSVALSRLGRVEDALAECRKAEALQPSDPRLIFNMALAYDKLRGFPAAVRYYQKFLELGDAAPGERTAVQARIRELAAFAPGEAK